MMVMNMTQNNEPRWTPPQSKAIASRNKTLLVSAAAGSGKTAVLTERIIKRITDKNNPADITRLCVVTFTRSAASELRDRISGALGKALRENPGNRRLERQLMNLGRAQISTIHSFCFEIVRANFAQLNLTARVRIADAAESDLIAREIMQSAIDGFYDGGAEGAVIDDFPGFTDNFVTDRDDRLVDIFLGIYRRLAAYPEGIGYIDSCTTNLTAGTKQDYLSTPWGKAMLRGIIRNFEYYRSVFEAAAENFKLDDKLAKNYLSAFRYEVDWIDDMLPRLREGIGYDTLRAALKAHESPRLGKVLAIYQTEDTEFWKESRKDFNKFLSSLISDVFNIEPDDISHLMGESAHICKNLGILLQEYERRLSAEKRRRGLIDYTDLERLTLKLLYDADGRLTETAGSIRARFDEIYIDEYQDVNELQDMIFRAIANPGGLFMVGDIKQSIYGFRGAAPDIFAKYRDSFREESSDSETIFLSDNFRCDRHVIEYVNRVSGTLFTNNSGRVKYYDEDALRYSKQTGTEPFKVKTVIVPKSADDEASKEAEYVAGEVKRLIEEGVKPSQITLLFRSTKKSAPKFENALKKLAIPSYTDTQDGFFENPEVLLAMCLLNCVDNPARDIYLAGALRSPIYGFSLSELADIRSAYPDGSLYDAFRKFADDRESPKAAYFLDSLAGYRDFAAAQPVSVLLWHIYRDTGLLAAVSADGMTSGRANLMMLYDYARRYESGSFKGLYNFILYINDIIENGEPFDTAATYAESGETVKLMTVHHSKGLEFPVVFLCDTNRSIHGKKNTDNLLLNRTSGLGIVMKLRDETGLGYIDTPMRRAVLDAMKEDEIDEEMRVLYVAMTRAKERLYVTGSDRNPNGLINSCCRDAEYISPFILSRSVTFLKWILTALYTDGDYGKYCDIEVLHQDNTAVETIESEAPPAADTGENELETDPAEVEAYRKLFAERFNSKYKWKQLSTLPAKLTVSKLYPGILDESAADSGVKDISSGRDSDFRRPKFLEPSPDIATAAERGTATHVFMQFANFELLQKNGTDEEIVRLVSLDFITAASAELIDRRAVNRFAESELFRRILSARKVWRELRFNVNLPADQFTESDEFAVILKGETVLVQGVVDCLIESENGDFVIIDYKTDHFTREQRYDNRAEAILRERYATQLRYYRAACERLIAGRIKQALIYSFSLGKTVEIID